MGIFGLVHVEEGRSSMYVTPPCDAAWAAVSWLHVSEEARDGLRPPALVAVV